MISGHAAAAPPIAVTIHQAGLVAAVKPVAIGPGKPAANTEPVTATPREEPTCRPVEGGPIAGFVTRVGPVLIPRPWTRSGNAGS